MPQYTTVAKVREAAGFVGNSNVPDSQIQSYIDNATAMVDSGISNVYQLPLPKFFENTITFTGTGSGSGTMTITIQSINYAIAIVNGLTASAAADLFRTAVLAQTSATFQTDGLGNGATVTLNNCNQNELPGDVTITSTDPQTVQGVTSTGGSVLEIGASLVESITRQIAAALLLIQEYGPESQDTDKDGYKKLAVFVGDPESTGFLVQISNKTMKVFDCSGTELPASSTKQVSFFPTEASRTDEEDPTANKITMNQLY